MNKLTRKINIRCLTGESIGYSIDEELFRLQIKLINIYKEVNKNKGFFDFLMCNVDKIKSKQAELNLIRGYFE